MDGDANDWFCLEAPAGSFVVVTISFDQAQGELALQLMSRTGPDVCRGEGGGGRKTAQLRAPAGELLIWVARLDRSTAVPYDLQVEFR